MGTRDTVVVASGADSAYACPLAVMLRSVADRLSPARRLEAHVIDGGLGAALRARIEGSLPSERLTLHWHLPDPRRFVGLPLWGRMTAATYHKLLLPELMPRHVTKALWLDADVLARADVAALWDAGLDGMPVRAAQDPVVGSVGGRFGVAGWQEMRLAPGGSYFNAGVLLMDLAMWRTEDISDQAFAYVRRHWRRVYFMDQEGLNAVLAGRWSALDPAWNWSPSLGAAGVVPRLIHFAGNLKPWRYRGRSPWDDLYYAEVDRTRWRGWRPAPSFAASLSRFGASPLRRWLRPVEQWHMAFTRWRSLRLTDACDSPRRAESGALHSFTED